MFLRGGNYFEKYSEFELCTMNLMRTKRAKHHCQVRELKKHQLHWHRIPKGTKTLKRGNYV